MTRNIKPTAKITRFADISASVYRPFGAAHKPTDVRRGSRVETLDALYAKGYQSVDELYAAIHGTDTRDPGMENAKRKIRNYLKTRKAGGK